jgi:Cu2+-exporting ATPase
LAKPFLIAVLLCAVLACVWWWSRDPEHALMVAVAVLVVTCPCALSLATPAAMLAAAGSLARGGVLVRRLNALEALAAVDTLVFDKTGTLTRDAVAVGRIAVREGVPESHALAMAAALAAYSLHPVSRAISAAGKACSLEGWRCDAVTEIAGQGVFGKVISISAPDAFVGQIRLGSARFCDVDASEGEGLKAYLSDEHGWVATFSLQEDLRLGVQEVVAELTRSGVTVQILSGDSEPSVFRLAEQAGIAHARGGCTPDDKLSHLRQLQLEGHKVAMVGDGLNDGPVLAGADVSFAFGQAVPLAQAQADFVVMGQRLMAVAETVTAARRTMRIVKQNLWWALFYNAACIPLAVAGWLPAWLAGLGMASSSLFVVINALRLSPRG